MNSRSRLADPRDPLVAVCPEGAMLPQGKLQLCISAKPTSRLNKFSAGSDQTQRPAKPASTR
jgi:hypothetical protein